MILFVYRSLGGVEEEGLDIGLEQRTHLSPRQGPGLQGPLCLGQSRSSLASPCMLCGPGPASSPPRIPAKLALKASKPPSLLLPLLAHLCQAAIPGQPPSPICQAHPGLGCRVRHTRALIPALTIPPHCTLSVKWRGLY